MNLQSIVFNEKWPFTHLHWKDPHLKSLEFTRNFRDKHIFTSEEEKKEVHAPSVKINLLCYSKLTYSYNNYVTHSLG